MLYTVADSESKTLKLYSIPLMRQRFTRVFANGVTVRCHATHLNDSPPGKLPRQAKSNCDSHRAKSLINSSRRQDRDQWIGMKYLLYDLQK